MEVDLAFIRCCDEAVVLFCKYLRNSPMRLDLVELDLAACALCQGLDLASGSRERVLDRDLNMLWLWSSEGWWLTTMFSWGGIVTQMLIR